ncbi:MAG: 50S ribosomal protein L27 [Candidatus Omnitrophota bacterium]
MARRGGLSHIHYREKRGLKVSAGEHVKAGSILTRQADKWKPGINVRGQGTLYALIDGEVYFTHRKSRYKTKKSETVINIKKEESKKTVK